MKVVAVVGKIGDCILFLREAGVTDFSIGPFKPDDRPVQYVVTETTGWVTAAYDDHMLVFVKDRRNVAGRVHVEMQDVAHDRGARPLEEHVEDNDARRGSRVGHGAAVGSDGTLK